MPCALCHKDIKLCRSHIIPEFLYEPIYDEKHRLQVLSVIKDKDDWLEQKGLRQHLLCEPCEQKLSLWEGYGRKVLKGGIDISYRPEHNIVHVDGINYQNFKLFQLSILWRASVSSLHFFKRVSLGDHEESLRQVLLRSDAGPPLQYPCVMFALRSPDGILSDLIMQPERLRLDGHNAYRFVFGGFLWAFVVSSHALPRILESVVLSESGSTSLLLRNPEEICGLDSFAKEHARLGRS